MSRRAPQLCALLAIALPSVASAHGFPPGVTQIVPRGGDAMVVATSRGLIFGDRRAQRGSLLCGSAFGSPDDTPYRLAVLPSGALLVASLEGLQRSDDDGCTWTRASAALGEADVTYLAQDPARPERVYASVFAGELAGIHGSSDGGLTFRQLYRAAQDEFIGTLLVGAQPSPALFATISTTEEIPRFFLLRSRDDGRTWARSALAPGDEVLDVGVIASNPASADELLLRVYHFDQRAGDALLRSRDGGASFRPVGRFRGVVDAAFTADGARVFVATAEGVMSARTTDYAFAPVGAAEPATHVTIRDGEVLAGRSRQTDAEVVPGVDALSTDAAAEAGWRPLLTFAEVTAARACPPPSPVACACESAWLDWSIEYPKQSAVAAPICLGP